MFLLLEVPWISGCQDYISTTGEHAQRISQFHTKMAKVPKRMQRVSYIDAKVVVSVFLHKCKFLDKS